PADGERWLADLQTLLGPESTALYPQRESLGAEEPHYELAGERIETIEALLRGAVRVLVTTARASAERTAVPAALEQARVVIEVSKEERSLTDTDFDRSEEHTSELQSRFDLVCRLLLEKKKKKNKHNHKKVMKIRH